MNIPIAEPFLGEAELENVTAAVRSGWVSSKGEFIVRFEQEFAEFCGSAYGVATSNGTTALHLALAALGIGPGDEVIVPNLTFIASANAVSYTGAKPVLVDVHPEYWGMAPERVAAKLTPRTRALMPVHLYGHPCDLAPLLALAKEHHLFVVEDAAEAHGAEYQGRRVGSLGDVGCFSFYGNKIITTGEGGMCVTSRADLAERMKVLRDHGMNPTRRYWHDVIGFNYRMTNLQAALGVAQLGRIEEFIAKKRTIAAWYAAGLSELATAGKLTLHPEASWAKCVYWMYSILVKESFGMTSESLREHLSSVGVDTRPFFFGLSAMPPYQSSEPFPVTESLAAEGINLPSAVTLTKEQAAFVIEAIRKAAQ